MNRRDFLKEAAALAAFFGAHSAFAQTPSPEAAAQARNKLLDSFAQKVELEQASPDAIEWIDGISDGTCCTFLLD